MEDSQKQPKWGKSADESYRPPRPENAYFLFSKVHRNIARQNNNLENRAVTKSLATWWRSLSDAEQKPYIELAKKHAEHTKKVYPGFTWCKPRIAPSQNLQTRPSNKRNRNKVELVQDGPITPGKLADESQMGGLNNLMDGTARKPTANDGLDLNDNKVIQGVHLDGNSAGIDEGAFHQNDYCHINPERNDLKDFEDFDLSQKLKEMPVYSYEAFLMKKEKRKKKGLAKKILHRKPKKEPIKETLLTDSLPNCRTELDVLAYAAMLVEKSESL